LPRLRVLGFNFRHPIAQPVEHTQKLGPEDIEPAKLLRIQESQF
jgi:hypothetical protein